MIPMSAETLRINEIFFSDPGRVDPGGASVRLRAADRVPSSLHLLRHRVRLQGGRRATSIDDDRRGGRPVTRRDLVEITGGEPLLQSAVHELVAAALRRGQDGARSRPPARATSARATRGRSASSTSRRRAAASATRNLSENLDAAHRARRGQVRHHRPRPTTSGRATSSSGIASPERCADGPHLARLRAGRGRRDRGARGSRSATSPSGSSPTG